MNKVTRSERLLNRLVDNDVLTPHGRDFLIAALDPMHDTQLANLAGWPDLADQPSVVRVFKTSKTINGLDESRGWDCVVRSLPILNFTKLHSTTRVANGIYAQDAATEFGIGPVVISAYDLNSDWALLPGQAQATWVMPLPDEVAAGNGRLIGMGIEVNNVSADLYKQGTTTVWRTPQQQGRTHTWNATLPLPSTGVCNGSFTGRDTSWGPANQTDAMLLAGSRQWKAADGAYCVVPFMSAENPIEPPEYIQPVFRLGDKYDSKFVGNDVTTIATNLLEPFAAPTGSIPLAALNKWAPVHSTGMSFTGLSPQTALTITVNYYYEYFPNSTDTSLVTMAKPSAAYDPVALQLYSDALSELPVGVPAYMNGFGDWFAGIVSKIAPLIGTALTPVLGPASAAIGMGAKGIADSYLAAQNPNTEPAMSRGARRRQKKKKAQPRLPPLPAIPSTKPKRRRRQ